MALVKIDTHQISSEGLCRRGRKRGACGTAVINAALAGGIASYGHPTSTVPAGGTPDAVVDRQGRVRGAKGLHVVDASLWPDVPSVATRLPTMMLAEIITATMV